jgi:hypothetical protein
MKCDTCVFCVPLSEPHENYCLCIWKPKEPTPSNCMIWEISALDGMPERSVSRWMPKEIVYGAARHLLKDCPAHEPKI